MGYNRAKLMLNVSPVKINIIADIKDNLYYIIKSKITNFYSVGCKALFTEFGNLRNICYSRNNIGKRLKEVSNKHLDAAVINEICNAWNSINNCVNRVSSKLIEVIKYHINKILHSIAVSCIELIS